MGRTLREEQKGPSGSLVQYLFVTAAGGVYGALAEKMPAARVGFGILFGSVLWFLSDEIALRASRDRQVNLIAAAFRAVAPGGMMARARGAHPVRGKGRAHPTSNAFGRLRTFFQPDSGGLQAQDERKVVMITRVKTLPPSPNLAQYRKQAKDLVKLWKTGDSGAAERVHTFHPRMRNANSTAEFQLADAQLAIAREHGFESWPKFTRHVEALARANSPVSQFELAADAIAIGDSAALERLLHENPELIRARSTRSHRGTLLHYIGANGIEDYRQKTPKNAVAILNILLEAGAEVDARAEMYQDDTALGLVASSINPLLAGVQEELVETLLAAGAAVDNDIVNACLANGRGHARSAAILASRVTRLELHVAAGVGRWDAVRSYFDEDGALREGATKKQIHWGLNWACEYGHTGVIEFLLEKGADPASQDSFGQTPLHWAAIGGQLEAVKILLKHGSLLEVKNRFGGTVLGQTVWSALHDKLGIDYLPVIEALLLAGAGVGASGFPTGHARIDDVLGRYAAA